MILSALKGAECWQYSLCDATVQTQYWRFRGVLHPCSSALVADYLVMSGARTESDNLAELIRLSREGNMSVMDVIDAVTHMRELESTSRAVNHSSGTFRTSIRRDSAVKAGLSPESRESVEHYYLDDENLVIIDLGGSGSE